MAAMTCGASGLVVGLKRVTRPSGLTTNFSKFHVMRPFLPFSSFGNFVSSW